jgi:hypothetical protein
MRYLDIIRLCLSESAGVGNSYLIDITKGVAIIYTRIFRYDKCSGKAGSAIAEPRSAHLSPIVLCEKHRGDDQPRYLRYIGHSSYSHDERQYMYRTQHRKFPSLHSAYQHVKYPCFERFATHRLKAFELNLDSHVVWCSEQPIREDRR